MDSLEFRDGLVSDLKEKQVNFFYHGQRLDRVAVRVSLWLKKLFKFLGLGRKGRVFDPPLKEERSLEPPGQSKLNAVFTEIGFQRYGLAVHGRTAFLDAV